MEKLVIEKGRYRFITGNVVKDSSDYNINLALLKIKKVV